MIRIFSIALFLLGAPEVFADIYKCVDEDGNLTYQQTPCPVESKSAETLESDETAEADDTRAPQANSVVSRTVKEVEACKNPLRDAIDGI